MATNISIIIEKFLKGKTCSANELKQLSIWLTDNDHQAELDIWLNEKWNNAGEKESVLNIEQIQKEISFIEKSRAGFKLRKLAEYYQRIAAILLIPIILGIGYYFISPRTELINQTQFITQRGQKSQLILPDNTKVWLNAETVFKYPSNFGDENRTVYLKGEAYFEVSHDQSKKFIVKADDININVLGTSFNVKAYPDEADIETTLYEGSIILNGKSVKPIQMVPGQSVNYYRRNKQLQYAKLSVDETLGWKNNRLVFRDDTFDKLVKKIERWYDVDIIYSDQSLDKQRLTVELLEGERLSRLLQIIELAVDVNYEINNSKIFISKKRKT